MFGKTPREWDDLDAHERRFLEQGFADYRERSAGSLPSL